MSSQPESDPAPGSATRDHPPQQDGAAEAQQLALRHMAAAVTGMAEGFAALDAQWRVAYLNPRAEAMLGVPARELLGRTIWEALPETATPEFHDACQAAARSGLPAGLRHYHARRDAWLDLRIHPAPDGLSIFVQDVSDGKRSEDARRHLLATLQSVIDSLPAYVSIVDAQQRYEFLNDRYETWFNRPKQDLLGRHLREVHTAAAYEEMRPYAQRALAGEEVRYERPLDDLYGEQHWFEVRYAPRRETDGSVSGYFAVVFDITERKRTEEALRANEQRLRVALRAPNVACFTQDRELRYTWMYQPQLGYTTDEVIGKGDADLLPPGAAQRLAEVKRGVLASGAGAREELSLAVGGSTLYFDVVVEPLRDAAGEIVGIAGASLDITDIVRAREELARLNAELEGRVAQRTAAIESFSYSVSHDLRAPLRAINGFARLLREDYGERLDAPGRESLDRICRASARMGELIDDLLTLTQLSRRELRRARVDLSALAAEIAAGLARSEPQRRVEFVAAPDIVVSGDAGLLRVVLDNLLGNAWKYTRGRQAARVEFGCDRGGGRNAIFVRDNGIGFDMAYASKLFRPFQRLHLERDCDGSGIGLATVQQIIGRHGGEIWAQARQGEGATFFFSLPG